MLANKSSDDSFYENLTLGLIKVLNNIPRITNINYEKRNSAERNSINAWESRHSVVLPDDMKRFYLCIDGFCLYWSYEYSANDVKRVGKIHIPHLIQITLVRENLETIITNPAATTKPVPPTISSNSKTPNINNKSKIFELSTILDIAKVCMIYEAPEASPKIYLLEIATLKCIFLAESFSEYMRMAVAHLGLPFWELCFMSTCKVPPWTEQLFLLLAPHLLENNETRKNMTCFHNGSDETPPFNTLDPAIFRTKQRCSKTR